MYYDHNTVIEYTWRVLSSNHGLEYNHICKMHSCPERYNIIIMSINYQSDPPLMY